MADVVVYEDTPLGDYLKDIDAEENLQRASDNSSNTGGSIQKLQDIVFNNPVVAVIKRTGGAIKTIFTSSLPIPEERKFEEKFKYIIVTSSLLNDTPTSHHQSHQTFRSFGSLSLQRDEQDSSKEKAGQDPSYDVIPLGPTLTLATFAIAVASQRFFSIVGINRESPRLLSWPSFGFPTLIAFYGLWSHWRRRHLQYIHVQTLKLLSQFIRQCQQLDTRLMHSLHLIAEVELVSRGYRISTPLPPASRIERSAGGGRTCTQLRLQVSGIVHDTENVFEEALGRMSANVNVENLEKLYDMYAIRSLSPESASGRFSPVDGMFFSAGTSLDGVESSDPFALESLKRAMLRLHLKRRKYLLHLLALRVMVEGHNSIRYTFSRTWTTVYRELQRCSDGIGVCLERCQALASNGVDYRGSPNLDHTKKDDPSDRRQILSPFSRQLRELDHTIRSAQAKLFLCADDVQSWSDVTQLDKPLTRLLSDRFKDVANDIEQLAKNWDIGRIKLEEALQQLEQDTLAPAKEMAKAPAERDGVFPSPPPSPAITALPPTHALTTDEDDTVPQGTPQVFEGTTSVTEARDNHENKLTRAERIQLAKVKREKEAAERSTRVESEKMVDELKDVLGRRLVSSSPNHPTMHVNGNEEGDV
ncbi:hypothetical protein BZG36_00773 [Bifiguratus adelaidae]|uniref:Vezatin n=1 Tax=Bifiguratus adelaidae TaxID=1938954 RepID=A0A261Y6Q1_9FUNG|nr:hypothetical protein BZG36_00773 [Bifiguratus adelaidae]